MTRVIVFYSIERRRIACTFSSRAPLPVRFGPPQKIPSVDASSERAFLDSVWRGGPRWKECGERMLAVL